VCVCLRPHQLYLHFKGFTELENLEEYTGLKALFLEGNAIETIENLPELPSLACLYLQQNCVDCLEGLANVPELKTLNVCNNRLSDFDGLEVAKNLSTLQAAHNCLETVEGLASLAQLDQLTTLDLSHNKIDCEPEQLLEALKAVPNLAVVYLMGNPVVSKVSHYRKTLICALPKLSYLDDRPVFEPERRCAEAWQRGGL